MKKITLILAAALLLPQLSQMTQANEQIARDNQCFKCHSIDVRKKAPSFQAIAREFGSDKNGIQEVSTVIRKGVKSLFGAEKMPANTRMSDADLQALATWILQQK
jgi:cytochrome c